MGLRHRERVAADRWIELMESCVSDGSPVGFIDWLDGWCAKHYWLRRKKEKQTTTKAIMHGIPAIATKQGKRSTTQSN